jgi:Uma2 family endonuclease
VTSTVFAHRRPLTDDEYLALGETDLQVELLDGSLLFSARGAPRHQYSYHAAAGIPWYLLVEQETGALHLYRLSGNHYVEHSVTQAGQVLRLTDPVEAAIAPEDLLPPG